MSRVAVIGTGAWGTALALSAVSAGAEVTLVARDAATAATLSSTRQNEKRLPGIPLPSELTIAHTVLAADLILLVTPAQTLRQVLRKTTLPAGCPLVICAKGLERGSGALLAEVAAAEAPGHPVALLSGPNFASEVSRGLPAAATIACLNETLATEIAARLSHRAFRCYASTDVTGVALGGALKNVVAIACGIVMGRRLGENARSALMTRGLAEIGRLALSLGARSETLMGLAGLGDLALTCSSLQSRNYSFGYHLGEGLDQAAAAGGNLSEGVATAEAVLTLAAAQQIEMPIARAVHAILAHQLSIEAAIEALMLRPLKAE